jgi:hypothetical protein
MRGADEQPGSVFSYVLLEERVPPDHPLRAIRRIRALEERLEMTEEQLEFPDWRERRWDALPWLSHRPVIEDSLAGEDPDSHPHSVAMWVEMWDRYRYRSSNFQPYK